MIITLGCEKGGVGKSTIALNLAIKFMKENLSVMLLDTDPQKTSYDFVQGRKEKIENEDLFSVTANGNIKNVAKDLANKYNIVIIDTAGKDGKELKSALLVSDILIAPLKASQIDLNTLPHLIDLIEQSKIYNDSLKAYVICSITSTNPAIKEKEEMKNLFTENEITELKLLSTIIYDRKVYRDCYTEYLGVIETNNKKAKNEIENLYNELDEE